MVVQDAIGIGGKGGPFEAPCFKMKCYNNGKIVRSVFRIGETSLQSVTSTTRKSQDKLTRADQFLWMKSSDVSRAPAASINAPLNGKGMKITTAHTDLQTT